MAARRRPRSRKLPLAGVAYLLSSVPPAEESRSITPISSPRSTAGSRSVQNPAVAKSFKEDLPMRYVRTALLSAAAVALPLAFAAGATAAQPPRQGMVLYDAAGTPVAILTPLPGSAPAVQADDPALPMLREMEAAMTTPFGGDLQGLFAAQEASMRAMQREMQSVAATAFGGPGQTIEVAMPPPGNGQVSRIYISSFSSGQGSCSQTLTYAYPGNGVAPVVKVHSTGDACGKAATDGSATLPTAHVPQRAPDGVKLLEVSAPTQPRPALRG
jgi:hypothetical protein